MFINKYLEVFQTNVSSFPGVKLHIQMQKKYIYEQLCTQTRVCASEIHVTILVTNLKNKKKDPTHKVSKNSQNHQHETSIYNFWSEF